MIKKELEKFIKKSFFPFVSDIELGEKIKKLGFSIDFVKKEKGVLLIQASNKKEFIRNFIFGINLTTLEMCVIGMNVAGRTYKYPNLFITVSNVKNKDFHDNIKLFIKIYSEEDVFSNLYININRKFHSFEQKPLYYFFLSNLKSGSFQVRRDPELFMASTIKKFFLNYLSPSIGLLSDLDINSKNKLKSKIIEKIVLSLYASKDLVERIKLILTFKKRFFELNIYPELFPYYKYNEDEYMNFSEEFFLTMPYLIQNYLIEKIQTINFSSLEDNSFIVKKYLANPARRSVLNLKIKSLDCYVGFRRTKN